MEERSFKISGRSCVVFSSANARYLLLQPVDGHDQDYLGNEVSLISAKTNTPFLLTAFCVQDWNRELSPWDAPPVFGRQKFGHDAQETLTFVEQELIPNITNTYVEAKTIPVIIGGYSLAALFSLWSVYQSDSFAAAAAASPSVWFPGWMDYAEQHTPKAKHIYLSLGDREEKAKNPVMAGVGDCIRRQYALLSGGEKQLSCVLEWNEGNHFQDSDKRCANAFSWCIHQIEAAKT